MLQLMFGVFFQKELDYNEIVELQGSALKQAQWF